jgi:acetyl-CoA carboxylase alpha subunit
VSAVATSMRQVISQTLKQLGSMGVSDRMKARYDRFRAFGQFIES